MMQEDKSRELKLFPSLGGEIMVLPECSVLFQPLTGIDFGGW